METTRSTLRLGEVSVSVSSLGAIRAYPPNVIHGLPHSSPLPNDGITVFTADY